MKKSPSLKKWKRCREGRKYTIGSSVGRYNRWNADAPFAIGIPVNWRKTSSFKPNYLLSTLCNNSTCCLEFSSFGNPFQAEPRWQIIRVKTISNYPWIFHQYSSNLLTNFFGLLSVAKRGEATKRCPSIYTTSWCWKIDFRRQNSLYSNWPAQTQILLGISSVDTSSCRRDLGRFEGREWLKFPC